MTPKASTEAVDETMDTSSKTEGISSNDSQSMTDCDLVTSSISEEDHEPSNLSDESFADEEEESTDWDSLGPQSHFDQEDHGLLPLENIYGIPRLGDPLPVVSEGSTLPDDPNTSPAGDASLLPSASTLEEETHEFHRDMNTTKVAFAAYRKAVLHLVHHQDRKSSTLRDNERMSLVEESAKDYVEYKAQTFHEAVDVAIDFRERGMERKKQRRALGLDLMNGKTEVEDNILSGLALLKQLKEEKAKKERIQKGLKEEKDRRDRNTSCASTTTKTKPSQEAKSRPASKPSRINPKEKVNTPKSKSKPKPPLPPKPKRTTQETIGVPCRKTPPRHPSCIKHTLPKYQYTHEEKDTTSENKENGAPMTYRTTAWIGSLVKWRKLREEHLEKTLRTCGCPDCQGELEVLMARIDIRSR